jgi:hypothetical protein
VTIEDIMQQQFNEDDAPDSDVAHLQSYEAYNQADNQVEPTATIPTRRSTRAWKPTTEFLENMQQEDIELQPIPISLEALHRVSDIETDETNPLSMIARADKDTMYWDQAMKQPDNANFIQGAKDKINTH